MINNIMVRPTLDHLKLGFLLVLGWHWAGAVLRFKTIARAKNATQPENQKYGNAKKNKKGRKLTIHRKTLSGLVFASVDPYLGADDAQVHVRNPI
jgi:hypothetical protein